MDSNSITLDLGLLDQQQKSNDIGDDHDKLPDNLKQRSQHQADDNKQYWQGAIETAELLADQLVDEKAGVTNRGNRGNRSLGLAREISVTKRSYVPWRTLLANFVIQSLEDYGELDLSLISLGYYSEQLISEKLYTYVLIDTSASISRLELSQFVAELKAIIQLFPSIEIEMFYCDSKLYGPYSIESIVDIPKARGGGGTSFNSFFKYVKDQPNWGGYSPNMIIFTDGEVCFSEGVEDRSLLWVLTAAGIAAHKVPYGRVIRLQNVG